MFLSLTFIPFSGSKQSTDKELARQRAEIEDLQKKLDSRLQNIQETKLPNSEGIA